MGVVVHGQAAAERVEGAEQPAGPVLTFEPETHTYRLDGQRVLSVTQALEAAGMVGSEHYTEDARIRGQYVHRMIQFDEREGLDESTVDSRLRGYLDAYRRFKNEVEPGPCLLLEEPLADPVLRFAGTPDQVRSIHGRWVLLDVKSGSEERWHRVQLAGYEHLIRLKLGYEKLARHVLYLRPDGSYKLSEEHRDRRDWKVFTAALTVAQWKMAA